MTIVEAIAQRAINLMRENNLSQKMLEEKSKIPHRSMNKLLLCKYKDIDLNMIYKLAKGFGLSIHQFTNDELFYCSNIEIKQRKHKSNRN